MPLFSGQGAAATNSAVYLLLQNHGDSLVQLVGGTSTAATAVEIHESRMVGGAMSMRPLEALPLPPDSLVVLRPGGVHLMLLGLVRSLEEGDVLDLTLEFLGAPDLSVSVPIRSAGAG
jgi:copper(I)-binding protein